jgi:hypothetical protein
MRGSGRRTTPRVVDGKVQRKNRTARTPNYWNTPQHQPVIDRRRPGSGYRHLLMKEDVARFVRILPNWNQLSEGLDAIVLDTGGGCYGWHSSGIVAVCAWDIALWQEWCEEFFQEHRHLLDRLGVPYELVDGNYLCKFEPPTVRAFQLIHILGHELGHHHDRMTTRSKRRASRGEPFAEEYARKFEALIWDRYVNEFGLP